jgi:acyl-coenzyme A thioesterase PaaI-like protein
MLHRGAEIPLIQPLLIQHHIRPDDAAAAAAGNIRPLLNGLDGVALAAPGAVAALGAAVELDDAAAPGGELTAVGRVERMGGRVCFCRVEITDCAGKKIAAMRATVYFTGQKLELE